MEFTSNMTQLLNSLSDNKAQYEHAANHVDR